MYHTIILNKLKDYLSINKYPYEGRGKILMFKCPYCQTMPVSANQIPNTTKLLCHACNKEFNLLDIVRKIEQDKINFTDEEIYTYLKQLFHLDIQTKNESDEIKQLFEQYKKRGWSLVPCKAKDKEVIESGWTSKTHYEINEWEQWYLNGLNLGVRTGQVSNLTVLDIDCLSKQEKIELIQNPNNKELLAKKIIPEDIKKVMGETLIQETFGGFQLFYKFDSAFPKTRVDGYNIDIETTGGQVIIPPSYQVAVKDKEKIYGYSSRNWINNNPILEMPQALKQLLLDKLIPVKKTNSEIEYEETKEAIQTEDFKIIDLTGKCNNTWIKLGGIFRKFLAPKETGKVLKVLNRHLLEDPMEERAIDAMIDQLDRYTQVDEIELVTQILDYLKITEQASKSEIEFAVLGKRASGEDRKKIDKAIVYLIKEEKIIRKGAKDYKIVKKMEWEESLVNVGVPINFKMPYFDDYAYFNWGDIIVIGSQNKRGKSHLAINIVKKIIEQGIKPYYIYSESGGRFSKIALKLGLKDGDFYHTFCGKPEEIKLEEKAITVYDWVRPTEGFHKTDELFDNLAQKMQKTQGILICFVQLKKDNGWFAENMITQYPALATKYLYEKESDGTDTYFEITEVRDAKSRGKIFKIPCQYNWSTKEVEIVKETPID